MIRSGIYITGTDQNRKKLKTEDNSGLLQSSMNIRNPCESSNQLSSDLINFGSGENR